MFNNKIVYYAYHIRGVISPRSNTRSIIQGIGWKQTGVHDALGLVVMI